MPMIDQQRLMLPIGRIRTGDKVDTGKTTRDGRAIFRPNRLWDFRLTTGSEWAASEVARQLGGEVKPWPEQRGQLQVYTGVSRLYVTVPPRNQVISQDYEMWGAGVIKRRCDSQHERIGGTECLCPHAADTTNADEVRACAIERDRLSKLNPSQACGRKTRINVMLPDLPGIGVWRFDSASFYVAGEACDIAAILEEARARDVYLPAELRIEERRRGDGTRFPVTALDVLSTFREVATGALTAGGWAAQLPPAPGGQMRAITAAAAPLPRTPADDQTPAAGSEVPPPAEPPDGDAGPGGFLASGEESAQMIADLAGLATTGDDVNKLVARCRSEGISPDASVCTDRDHDAFEPLRDYLAARYTELTGQPA